METVRPGAGSVSLRSGSCASWTTRARRAASSSASLTAGSSVVECVVDDVLRHPGALKVDAVEPVRVLADGDAAADADVLGHRPDQVDRAVDVEGGAGQHAGEGGVGQARRAPAAQVNVGGNGTGPAVRSHPPSLRRPAPDYRVAVGVALGWSREALVAALLGLALGVRPAADAVAVGVGGSVVGVVGVVEIGVDELDARRVGMAVGEALADGDGDGDGDVVAPSRTGDGTGRGRVLAPAGPTGTTG